MVREAVREIRQLSREVFMPLVHRPGEAQSDFGYALARISGELREVAFLDGAAVLRRLFCDDL